MSIYLVRGCGVTLICTQGLSMVWWIKYMVNRGGVPTIERIQEVI